MLLAKGQCARSVVSFCLLIAVAVGSASAATYYVSPRLDLIRTEPTCDYACQGDVDSYMQEAALAQEPPSGTVYDPNASGRALKSLGVHEHWNSATMKQYSRNLGRDEGIELLRVGLRRGGGRRLGRMAARPGT